MKKLILFLFFIFTSNIVQSQNNLPKQKSSPGYLSESAKYVFFSHYWLNMHHFLHHEARIQSKTDSSSVKPRIWRKLSTSEKNVFDEVVAYYQNNLIDKDLRRSGYMSSLKSWIIGQKMKDLSPIPGKFKEHSEYLEKFSSIYEQYFWQTHSAQNKKVLSERMGLIQATEDSVFKKNADLAHSYWPSNNIRVDITYYGGNSGNNAFTTIFPTHVVIPSTNLTSTQGSWTEILYHEATHQIIRGRTGFVAGTINNASAVIDKGLRSLWHAYLFYMVGDVVKNTFHHEGIKDYEMYMIRNDVFGLYIPALKKYMPEYLNQKTTLADVTKKIIRDVQKELEGE